MSKAFTKETDNDQDEPLEEQLNLIDVNVKNYVTPFGYAALQNELSALVKTERPHIVSVVRWAAGNGDRSENGDYIYGKRRLREIDRRVRYLIKRIDSAIIVDPAQQQKLAQIYFGASVTVILSDGSQQTLKIVGLDEADIEQHKISWQSPIAQALFKNRVGDKVIFDSPQGTQTLEIIALQYN